MFRTSPYHGLSQTPGFFEYHDIASNMLEAIQREVQRTIHNNFMSSLEHIYQSLRSVLGDFMNNISPFLDFSIDLDSNHVIDDIQEIRITIRWMFEEGISNYEIIHSMNRRDVAAMNPMFERRRGRRGGLPNYQIQWDGIDWDDVRSQQIMENTGTSSHINQTDYESVEVGPIADNIRRILNQLQEEEQHSSEEVRQQQEKNNNSSNLPEHLFKIE